MTAAKVPYVNTVMFHFTSTTSSEVSNSDVLNEMNLTNVIKDHEYLILIVLHSVILRELGNKMRKNWTDDAAENLYIWTRAISMVHIYLQYISSLAIFEE